MNLFSVRRGLCPFLLFVLFMPVACYGQTFTGDIAGTIKDSTAAVTPGAIVTVTSKATGATKTFVTSDDGSYRFAELPPASYVIKVELEGFKAATRELVLSVAQKLRVDFTLEVGSPEEILHIEMVAGPLAVQTESYEISQLIDAETLVELPTVTRNAGSIINVVTKSGSNRFHGSLYEFYRLCMLWDVTEGYGDFLVTLFEVQAGHQPRFTSDCLIIRGVCGSVNGRVGNLLRPCPLARASTAIVRSPC